jgi:hypothetical protein
VGCDETAGPPFGLVQANENLVVALDGADGRAVLAGVQELWEAAGLAVRPRFLDSEAPALFAEDRGFTLSLEVPLRKGEAHLRGSTPCLPPD